jgi:hypothetical protein
MIIEESCEQRAEPGFGAMLTRPAGDIKGFCKETAPI